MLYASGLYMNALSRALAVTSSGADANHPLSNLYDGRPITPFRFSTYAGGEYVQVDMAIFEGNLNTWSGGLPVGWSVAYTGNGTVVEGTGSDAHAGSAAKLSTGVIGTAFVYRDVVLRAGEQYSVSAWSSVRSGSGTADLEIYNLETGKYLKYDGTWTASKVYFLSNASGTWTESKGAFTLESYETTGTALCNVRIQGTHSAGAVTTVVAWDDVYIWPRTNLMAGFGHNASPYHTLQWRTSTDGFSGSDNLEASITMLSKDEGTFYAYLSTPTDERYARLKVANADMASRLLWFGELVLTYAQRGDVMTPVEIQFAEDQERTQTRGFETHVTQVSQVPRRVVRLSGKRTDVEWGALRGLLWATSRGGAYPTVLVPLEPDAGRSYLAAGERTVIHCLMDSSWRVRRKFLGIVEDEMTFAESPFPVVVP